MEISALVPIQRTVLATTTPFLTSTCTAGVCKQECTAGIFLAYTKKKGPPQFKNSFPASVRYATLIRNSSLNLKKKCHCGLWETSCTQKRLQKGLKTCWVAGQHSGLSSRTTTSLGLVVSQYIFQVWAALALVINVNILCKYMEQHRTWSCSSWDCGTSLKNQARF